MESDYALAEADFFTSYVASLLLVMFTNNRPISHDLK